MKHQPTGAVLALLLAGILQIRPGSCHGQDTLVFSDTLHLEDIVVVGKRIETPVNDRSEAISVLNRRSLETFSPMNMPDAMDAMPGVFMQRTNNGGGSPFVRGLTGYHTLILVDGIRLNNAVFRSGPNQYLNTVDPLMIEQIEVLRGPGSVQYGTDAIGGTIYLRTAEVPYATDGLQVGGKVYGKWLSHNMEKTGRAQLHLSTPKLTLSAGITRKDFGNTVAGGGLGELEHTSYDEYSADVKIRAKLGPSQQITFSWQRHRQNDVQLYHKLITGDYTTYAFDPQQRDLIYLRHEVDPNQAVITGIRTTFSLHRSDETRKIQRTGSNDIHIENDLVHSYGLTTELVMDREGAWSGVTGFEFYHDGIRSSNVRWDLVSGRDSVMRGLYPDRSFISSISAFSMHTVDLGALKLDGGIRYNHFILGLDDEVFGELSLQPHALVGSLGISYRIFRRTDVSLSIQNAFRAPNINDVSSFGIADFRYEVPNFNLSPEKSLNKELGIKTDQKFFSGALFLYHNRLKDMMINVQSSYLGQDSIDGVKVYRRENTGEAFIRGVEGELQLRPAGFLSVRTHLIYTYGQNISGKEPLRRIPPLNGLTALQFQVLKNLDMIGEWLFAGKQERLSAGDVDDPRIPDGGTPAWNVINLRFSYRIAGLRLNTGLLNLLDEPYRTHGSGVDELGRSVYLSLLYSFSGPPVKKGT